MKKATRKFLADKQSMSNICRLVNVQKKYVENAKPNHCYRNAANLCDSNEKYILQSGWLIGDYFGDRGTAIIPHYWVVDSETNISYDSTPYSDAQKFEYVFDFEVMKYASAQSILPPCLKLLSNGEYLIRLNAEYFISTDDIDTGYLYERLNEYELS